MSEPTPITESEQMTITLFNLLGNDVAAVKLAKEFVGTSTLKMQLLQMSISESFAAARPDQNSGSIDWVVVARKSVDAAQHKLTAF